MEKVIRLEENLNKVYFVSSIISIEYINKDHNGNTFTLVSFSDGTFYRTSNHIDDILYNLKNQDGDLILEEYKYKIRGKEL